MKPRPLYYLIKALFYDTVSQIPNPLQNKIWWRHLHLHRLAVDELADRDDVLEDHVGVLASDQDDVADFAFNLNQEIS